MSIEVSRLANGLTVATDTLPHVDTVALGVWVKSGSRNERDDEHGIAHLLEHMAFKGTGKRSAWTIASGSATSFAAASASPSMIGGKSVPELQKT